MTKCQGLDGFNARPVPRHVSKLPDGVDEYTTLRHAL